MHSDLETMSIYLLVLSNFDKSQAEGMNVTKISTTYMWRKLDGCQKDYIWISKRDKILNKKILLLKAFIWISQYLNFATKIVKHNCNVNIVALNIFDLNKEDSLDRYKRYKIV